ncbi:MAG: hypothetical protein A2516_01245 [Alphaproteobacteria bacterium RIFOXYD12_FULL_60_8]|nr:MAG: hypothetical protein A2516_01245 [Alphaproteobacteria bacterium RIFOXYD12_FULL_60_8]
MTIQDATAHLKALGIKKAFKPSIEPETGAVLLRTRKAAQILDGALSGSEIVLRDSDFLVWTSQKRRAKSLASLHDLKVRLLDGEAELIVPAALADELLPQLGAKVARTVRPEVAERARAVLQRVREAAKHSEAVPIASNFAPKPAQERTSGDVPASLGPVDQA